MGNNFFQITRPGGFAIYSPGKLREILNEATKIKRYKPPTEIEWVIAMDKYIELAEKDRLEG